MVMDKVIRPMAMDTTGRGRAIITRAPPTTIRGAPTMLRATTTRAGPITARASIPGEPTTHPAIMADIGATTVHATLARIGATMERDTSDRAWLTVDIAEA